MSDHHLPDWMQSALDQRFIQLSKIVSESEEVNSLRQKHSEIEIRLKQELSPDLFRIILDYEDVLNYRNACEKQRIYIEGLKDGLRLYKQLQDFISADVEKP